MSLSNGLTPIGGTLADLNGSDIPDLIVPDPTANAILIYPGLGDGQYGLPEVVDVGDDPVAVTAAALIPGNPILDLVVTNQGSNDLSVLIGRVEGGVWSPSTQLRLKAGYDPTGVAVLNVNGDGIPDLVVSDVGSNEIREILGIGNGYFNVQDPTIISTGMGPGAPIVGDFTGVSGELDLVTINRSSNDLTFIRDINEGGRVPEEIASGRTCRSRAWRCPTPRPAACTCWWPIMPTAS